MSKAYIVADKMTKLWKTKKVSISFSLAKGETMSLLGPSGSGKSSILKMISGLIKIDSGHLYFDSKDVSNVPPGKRGVGMVFQDYALFPHLTVEDNIAYGLLASGVPKKKLEKRSPSGYLFLNYLILRLLCLLKFREERSRGYLLLEVLFWAMTLFFSTSPFRL